MASRQPVVLIVEDGDEYWDNLTRFVTGPQYLQAKNGKQALDILNSQLVDLVYLDMRFDRIGHNELLGDHEAITHELNSDPIRAWRHLANNQGLFILDAMKRSGFGEMPVVLAYDFTGERRRFEHLKALYPGLHWIPDAIASDEIRALVDRLTN